MVSEVLVVALPSLYFLESLEESFGCGLGLLPFGRSKGGCVERHVRSLSVRGKEESGVLRIDQGRRTRMNVMLVSNPEVIM